MVMPYIGALKSAIYYPIFLLFGVSVLTIRLPAIILGALALLVWYKVGGLIFKEKIYSLLLIILMAFDPAYIFQSKLDWGPIVLQTLFTGLSAYCFFKAVKATSKDAVKYWLPLLYLCLLLGLYNKLNFIWFIVGLGVAILIFYFNKIKEWIALGLRFIVPFLLFALLLCLVGVFLVIPTLSLNIGGGSSFSLSSRILYIFNLYLNTMDGRAVFSFITTSTLRNTSWINYFNLYIALVWVVALVLYKLKKLRFSQNVLKLTYFFITLFIVEFAQIIVTKQATGPYHIIILWPLEFIILLLMIQFMISVLVKLWSRKSFYLSVAILLSAVLVVTEVRADLAYNQAFAMPRDISYRWSPAIYQLSSYINSNYTKVNNVIFTDWGIGNQILTLAKSNTERAHLLDYWPMFSAVSSNTTNQQIYDAYFQGKQNFVVFFANNKEIVTGSKQHLFNFLIRNHLSYTLAEHIPIKSKDYPNSIYSIYFIR